MTDDRQRKATLAEDARVRFEARYERCAQWDIGQPQPAIVELAEGGRIRGRVLDAGCGAGDNGLFLAARGLDVWGIDVVPGAISRARERARNLGIPPARFLVADALDLPDLGLTFDTVVDSGLFHAFDDEERAFYREALDAVVPVGGDLHILCFSDRQPGTDGPRRVSIAEIVANFRPGWRLVDADEVRFLTNIHPGGALAWRASLTRT